jgi:DNA-binding NtrC family response regulator
MMPALKLVSDTKFEGGSARNGKAPRPGNGTERKPTILMVEDEILIRMTAADHLRKRGFRVLEASNASEALSVFAAGEPIELVFTDIDMPGSMTGAGLSLWIRKHFPDVKVLLTSDNADFARAEPRSAQEPFLRKPYAFDVLVLQIHRLLMA